MEKRKQYSGERERERQRERERERERDSVYLLVSGPYIVKLLRNAELILQTLKIQMFARNEWDHVYF